MPAAIEAVETIEEWFRSSTVVEEARLAEMNGGVGDMSH